MTPDTDTLPPLPASCQRFLDMTTPDTLPPLPELPAAFGTIVIEKPTRKVYLQGYTPYQVRKLLREYGAQCRDHGAEAERERCAKLCEAEAELWRGQQDITDFKLCAARIRAEADTQQPTPAADAKETP